MSKCIVLDVTNLAYRALHTVGDLVHPENPEQYTGVLYQLYKTAEQLTQQFSCRDFAFCFDSHQSERAKVYPAYKAKRKEQRDAEEAKDPDAKRRRAGMIDQLLRMPKILHSIGAKNIFGQTGYEADDMMASIVANNADVDLILVSTDQDIYQLLSPGVQVYNPVRHIVITHESFAEEWGISPSQWASTKAWAGCASDNITGLPGVAEKTAIKWLQGKLKPDTVKYRAFTDGLNVYSTNIGLVRLPYPGTQVNKLTLTDRAPQWITLADMIGSNSHTPEGIRDDDY